MHLSSTNIYGSLCEAAHMIYANISPEMVAMSASGIIGSGRKQEVSALLGNANKQ